MRTEIVMATAAPVLPAGPSSASAKARPGVVHILSSTALDGFGVTARELSKLHVAGMHDECLAQLDALGGVRGLADKLNTKLRSGIVGRADDVSQRQRGYVVVRETATARRCSPWRWHVSR